MLNIGERILYQEAHGVQDSDRGMSGDATRENNKGT